MPLTARKARFIPKEMINIKKFLFSLFLLFMFFISGCTAKEESETFFIHGAAFEKDGENVSITLLSEHLSGDKSDYSVIEQKAENLSEAAEKIKKKYRECYFATCRFYLFTDKADKDFLLKVAKELCDGNDFPITANIFIIRESPSKAFLASIEDGKDLKSFMSLYDKNKLNIIRFFAHIFSEKDISVPTLRLSDDGKAEKDGKAVFKKKRGVIFE